MISSKYHQEIIEHAESNKEEEICGLVILNKDLTVRVKRLNNSSSTPKECFAISAQDFINNKIKNKILSIYHSHPFTDEEPSKQDILVSEELGIPYLIYSLKSNNFFLYYPESYIPDSLIGRPYIKGLYECTCLLKDYFISELNINITKWNKNYWLTESDKEANQQLNKILNKNLNKVEINNIKKHDVIVFEVKQEARRHVGVYIGDDYFIHQCGNTISRRQILDNRWQAKIKELYRHPSLV